MRSNIRTVETACNSCGANQCELVTTGCEHEYDNTTDDTFTVVRCTNCNLTYLNPRPDISELPTIYPSNYYSYSQQRLKEQTNPHSLLHQLRYRGFRTKISKSLNLCPVNNRVAILDIGCGDGHTLNLYRDTPNFSVETHGVDFNAAAVEEASRQGHKTYNGRFEDVSLPREYFQLVTASHVIEHVADPKTFSRKVYSILAPGGIFWFETPNIGSVDAKIFKTRHWGGYHFPRHWFFYTPNTIRDLARQVGFEVVMIDYYPNAIFWFWTFHSMICALNPNLRKLADVLFPPVEFQRDTLANFVRICFFCSIDLVIKLATGQTSNMVVAFRKSVKNPESSL